MNLFEILRSAGGGEAFKTLAAQYGMSEADVRRAAEALLPAFSAGLKQSTGDPLGLMAFMRQLAAGNFMRAYAEPGVFLGSSQGAANQGLQMLFGSAAATEAVLQQASAFSGLAVAKLRELMAPFAAMMLGGLATHSKTANPLLDAMLKQFGPGAPASGAAPKGPLDRWEEEQARREREASALLDFQRLQVQLMESGLAAFQAGTAAWQQAMRDLTKEAAAASGEPDIRLSGHDLFGEMFESGVQLSESYRREMEKLVEQMRPKTPEK